MAIKWGGVELNTTRLGIETRLAKADTADSRLSSIPIGTNENKIVVMDGSGNLKYRTNISLTGATGINGRDGFNGRDGNSHLANLEVVTVNDRGATITLTIDGMKYNLATV